MEQSKLTNSRKKFLLWGAALLSSITALKFLPGSETSSKEPAKKTVKMLTQDGKLVEVDADRITYSKRNKINDEQLKNWIIEK